MKTEKEVKAKLKETKLALLETQRQFDEYDNHDDLEELDRLKSEVKAYKWVLSK